MSEARIERAALGRIYGLGDLYDARSDSFCGISLLKTGLPPSCVETTDNNHTDMKYIIGDNLSDKFSRLDVCAELSISVMAGLLPLSGSAKYLDTKKESKRAGQASLVYNILTKVERLNISSEELRKCVLHDALSHENATHVVVEVYWGANSLITVKDENVDNEDKTKIEGQLSATLRKACLKISGEAGVEFEESEMARSRNYSFQIFGDVLADRSQLLPNTIEDAIKMMQKMPALVQKANDGKGKPLKYGLLPLFVVKSFLKDSQGAHVATVMLRSLDKSSVDRFMNLLNEIAQYSQEVHDIIQDIGEMENKLKCVPVRTAKQINEIKQKISQGESKLRVKLAAALKKIRSGKGEMTDLEPLISEYMKSENCADKLTEVCREEYKALKAKSDLVKRCQQYSVTYLTSVEDGLLDMGEMVVLYGNTEKAKADETKWAQNRKVFFNLANENQNKQQRSFAGVTAAQKFYYIDCDFDPVTAERKGIRIEKYKDGECVDDDYAHSVNVASVPTSYDYAPRVVHTLPETESAIGVTLLDDKLYVLRKEGTEQVWVYNTTTTTTELEYRLVRRLSVPGARYNDLWDMTSCKHYRCLYIADYRKYCVRKVELNGEVTKLSVGEYNPTKLSVTSRFTVLVTFFHESKLLELTTEGKQLRVINLYLQPDIVHPQHAIQLSNGQFVVSYGADGDPVHQVCIVDTNGHVTQSYGGPRGSAAVGKLNHPWHLAVDKDEFIFVAETGNNRLLLLSPTLSFVREIEIDHIDQWKGQPQRLFLDVDRRRLYVADCFHGVVVVQL